MTRENTITIYINIPWVHPLNLPSFSSNYNHNHCNQVNTNEKKTFKSVMYVTHTEFSFQVQKSFSIRKRISLNSFSCVPGMFQSHKVKESVSVIELSYLSEEK